MANVTFAQKTFGLRPFVYTIRNIWSINVKYVLSSNVILLNVILLSVSLLNVLQLNVMPLNIFLFFVFLIIVIWLNTIHYSLCCGANKTAKSLKMIFFFR